MQSKKLTAFAHCFFVIFTFIFLFPLVIILMISVTAESEIVANGYQIIPGAFSLDAYRLIFSDVSDIARAVLLTLASAIVAPALKVALCMMMAYPLSQNDFKLKKFWTWYVLFTMLFSGGLIPTYIVNTQLLGLQNNIAVYFVTGLMDAWTIILFRTFFVGIPSSLLEAATLDGASKMQTLIRITLPMTKPLVAMQFFSGLIGKWNNLTTPMYYITDKKLFNIQYLLQKMLDDMQQFRDLFEGTAYYDPTNFPVESMKFAMIIVGVVPVLCIFPYVQKFYAKGVSVGAVKG